MKSKVEMELKIASTLKKKVRIVKKLKEKFGEGANEEEEEEDEEDEEEEQERNSRTSCIDSRHGRG